MATSGYAFTGYQSSTGDRFTPESWDPKETGEYWTLAKCKQAYLDYLWLKREEIDEQQEARRYRHGVHWTAEQITIFNNRKQPVVTYNRIGRKIDAVVGLMEKLKQDPKGFPLTPGGEAHAELATACVRSVVQSKLREFVFPFVADNGATDGFGGVEMLLVQGKNGDIDIGFSRMPVEDSFYDPRSFMHDFSDARYMGIGRWMHVDDVAEIVPERAEEVRDSLKGGDELTSSPDKDKRWFNEEKNFVRVVEIWYRHRGGWCWCLFTGGQKLLEGKSYFFDETGKAICKFIMFSAFVDQDGDRYGFFRNLKSAQDEINQRRSKGLHELHSRRIKAEDGAFADVEVARREAVKPDGILIYNRGFEMEFDDAARVTNIEGQIKFLEDAKNEIENFGPNPALIGQGLEYKSGRAISLLQQSGIAELGPFVINYKNWKLRVYRAIWSACQRYWTQEKWIRVAPYGDAGDEAQFLQINGLERDPMTGMPRQVNAIGQLDVSFTLDEGPDEVNMMADAYDTLTALATQGAKIPPDILLELAPLQNSVKKRLIDIYQKAQQPPPEQQQATQLELQRMMAEIREILSKVELNVAKARSEAEGGRHNVQEHMIDLAGKQQEHQFKREEHMMKRQEMADKLQTERIKAVSDVQSNEMKNQQQLRQSEEQHQVGLRRAEEAHRQKLSQAERSKEVSGSAKRDK